MKNIIMSNLYYRVVAVRVVHGFRGGLGILFVSYDNKDF